MGTVNKAIVLVTGLLAILTAVGGGFTWVHHHVSIFAWLMIGLAACSATWGTVGGFALGKVRDHGLRPFIAIYVSDLVISAAIVLLARNAFLAPLSVGLGFAIPSVGVLYWYDKLTHKKCPECSERVKAGASVCRYCHHEFKISGQVLYVVSDDTRRQT